MSDLAAKNSKGFQNFKSGGFVVRRSERHWTGLTCDLTIEQVLMRSLKTTGGLTRGTGLSDVQRSIWLLSKPVCSNYSLQMEDNIGILHSTSEQHKSIGKTRLKRDIEDTGKIMDRLQNVSPFDGVQSLINTVNGVVYLSTNSQTIFNLKMFFKYIETSNICETTSNFDFLQFDKEKVFSIL